MFVSELAVLIFTSVLVGVGYAVWAYHKRAIYISRQESYALGYHNAVGFYAGGNYEKLEQLCDAAEKAGNGDFAVGVEVIIHRLEPASK